MEHHFVVKFSAETRTWSWDVDTENAVFTEGTILLGEQWVRSGNIIESHPHVYGLDEICSKVLVNALTLMNTTLKEAELSKPIPLMEKKIKYHIDGKPIVTEMDGVS
jgi:hypothetical protein